MHKSKINFEVSLDDNNVPQDIQWDATDKDPQGYESSQAISVNIWDHKEKNTLRMDLWTQQLPVLEMKRFAIDTIGGMAQTILNATGDEHMSEEINSLCEKLVQHVESENQQGGSSQQ